MLAIDIFWPREICSLKWRVTVGATLQGKPHTQEQMASTIETLGFFPALLIHFTLFFRGWLFFFFFGLIGLLMFVLICFFVFLACFCCLSDFLFFVFK